MKRTAGALVLLAALGGCVSAERSSGGPGGGGGGCQGCYPGGAMNPSVPGLMGPGGEPVPMIAPYSAAPPPPGAARAMLEHSIPLDLVQLGSTPARHAGTHDILQAADFEDENAGQGLVVPAGGPIAPPGVPPIPGMGPPGPAGAVAALKAFSGAPASRFPTCRTEVRFVRPAGMRVSWFALSTDGKPGFASTQIDTPGRYNFPQGAIYRLKLSNIEGRAGMVLYPTLEVVPSNAKTDPFLAHSSVPVEFTNEDFDQVAAGNYVVKVIYLPNPSYQEAAGGGLEEINSARLEPGVDPIQEALRRGSILLVIRLGNILLELDNTPPMDAPNPYACPPGGPPAGGPGPGFGLGMPGPAPMLPYYGVNGPAATGRPPVGGPMGVPPGLMMGSNVPPMMRPPMNPQMPFMPGMPGMPGGPMMMGPNGPMAGGPMMMGPNGPMMGPNGPMMGPNGPMAGGPMMPPGGGMPYPFPGMPGMPGIPPGLMANPNGAMLPPGLTYGAPLPPSGGPGSPNLAPSGAPVLSPTPGSVPAVPKVPGVPTGSDGKPAANPGIPVTRLPDALEIKQVEFDPKALPAGVK